MELRGFPMKKAQRELQITQSLSPLEYDNYVENLKWKQFEYLKANNSFYKGFLGGRQVNSWADIPIITKTDLQRPLSQLLSNGLKRSEIYVDRTSGSSGTPFYFAKNKMAHAKTWALILDRYSRHGIEYGKSLQARFYGIPLTGKNYYKEKIKDFISNRIRFPVFDITDEKLEKFVLMFRKYNFEYINGYTSSLVYFASYLIERGEVLVNICPSLKICFPTSEMCSKSDRLLLEKGFGIKVANEYGCAEMDIIAFEDENFDWIISNENLLLEIVDDSGQVIDSTDSGRVVITSLFNSAIPLIRYDLGDIASLDTKKKGWYSILFELFGRSNDFAILPNGKKVPALTFYYITRELIQEEYGIKEFIIRQKSLDLFHFEYVADKDLSLKAICRIEEAAGQYLGCNVKTSFERKRFITRTKAGKLKQFFKLED